MIWTKQGTMQDVVISSRVRLARNFADVPFPNNMNYEDAAKIKERVLLILKEDQHNLEYYEVRNLGKTKLNSLVEKHYCSKDLTKTPDISAIFMSQDRSLSVMVNEEDHLRIQALQPGLDIEGAAKIAESIDALIHESEELAYQKDMGYLTSCPTNLGEGLRVSVMVMVPALNITGQIKGTVEELNKLGMTCRGFFGEGSQPGAILQISNKGSMGYEGKDVIHTVDVIAHRIIATERAIREQLINNKRLELEDRILRTYGLMKYARKLTPREIIQFVSNLWLGVSYGLIEGLNYNQLVGILMNTQNATLLSENEALNRANLSNARADYVQKVLSHKDISV